MNNQKPIKMEQKVVYEAPSTMVIEVKIEGVVCQSELNDPTDYLNGGDPFAF